MREKMNQLPKAVVVVMGVIVAFGFLGVIHGVGFLINRIPGIDRWPEYGLQLLGEGFAALYAVGMMFLFGFGIAFKERGEGFLRGFYTAGFMFAMCFVEVIAQFYLNEMSKDGKMEPFFHIVLFVLTMLLIGIAEEGVFRGVLLNLFLNRFSKTKTGIISAVLLNGVLFGSMHMFNYFSGVSIKSVVVQSITAVILGILFSAIYLRSGNLWICILLHGGIDLGSMLQSGIFGRGDVIDSINQISYINLISVGIYLIPCLVLLRRSKLEQLVMRANGVTVFETDKEADHIAIVSLILGICTIMTSCLGFTLGMGIVGVMAANISKQIKKENNGMAIAGLITSLVGVCFAIIGVIALGMVYATMDSSMMDKMIF